MDVEYWNSFYKKYNVSEPSSFCLFVVDYFKDKSISNILDAGCGNGRDSYHLSTKYNVVGSDISGFIPHHATSCNFETSNFVTMDKEGFDMIYSRFTFHSISNNDHIIFLNSIPSQTYLCIETRSDKGILQTRHHGDDHYRNFTNLDYLINLLSNFEILYIKEDQNMAIYKNENPYCIRVICKKL